VIRLLGVTPKFTTTKFSLKELEVSPYCMAKMRFDILNRLGVDNQCSGLTDRLNRL